MEGVDGKTNIFEAIVHHCNLDFHKLAFVCSCQLWCFQGQTLPKNIWHGGPVQSPLFLGSVLQLLPLLEEQWGKTMMNDSENFFYYSN